MVLAVVEERLHEWGSVLAVLVGTLYPLAVGLGLHFLVDLAQLDAVLPVGLVPLGTVAAAGLIKAVDPSQLWVEVRSVRQAQVLGVRTEVLTGWGQLQGQGQVKPNDHSLYHLF